MGAIIRVRFLCHGNASFVRSRGTAAALCLVAGVDFEPYQEIAGQRMQILDGRNPSVGYRWSVESNTGRGNEDREQRLKEESARVSRRKASDRDDTEKHSRRSKNIE